jgi:hypothetical protein
MRVKKPVALVTASGFGDCRCEFAGSTMQQAEAP